MKRKTLQEQYNQIKKSKGSKEIFLKEAKKTFPNYIHNVATFNQAEKILRQKSIISENIWGVATGKTEQPDWFKIFNENVDAINESKELEKIIKNTKVTGTIKDLEAKVKLKAKEAGLDITDGEIEDAVEKHADEAMGLFEEVKAVEKKTSKEVTDLEEKNFDYKDKKDVNNVYGEAFLNGYYTEMKDPKNIKKTIEEVKEIVAKNLAKDQLHYVKDGQFGERGVGYTDEHPGLKASKSDQMEKVKLKESRFKLKENYSEFQRVDKGEKDVAAKDKAEEEVFGAGVERGEEIEKKKSKKKPKKETIDTKLAEIDRASGVVALEAKIEALAEIIESKTLRLNTISEDEDLSELMDKTKVKNIQKEIKLLEKRKAGFEKLYEKSCGKAYQQQEIMGENEDLSEDISNDEKVEQLKIMAQKLMDDGDGEGMTQKDIDSLTHKDRVAYGRDNDITIMDYIKNKK